PVLPVIYSAADDQLQLIRSLRRPSVIAVVSASQVFLTVARSLLIPAAGRTHSIREILLRDEKPSVARSADIIFCNSIAKRSIRDPKAIHYRLIAAESLKYISAAMNSYQVRIGC